jgi:hypothetical protein
VIYYNQCKGFSERIKDRNVINSVRYRMSPLFEKWRYIMVTNNIELDVKVKCLEAGMTQQQVGDAIGTTGQYVNRIVKKKDGIVNKTFVQMMEALGYDIELTYVKREEK